MEFGGHDRIEKAQWNLAATIGFGGQNWLWRSHLDLAATTGFGDRIGYRHTLWHLQGARENKVRKK